MRIAYLTADQGVAVGGCNGASTHVREFVRALVARGAEVKILTPRPPGGAVGTDVIDVQTDQVIDLLRRRTARTEGASDGVGTQASEVHGLLLNQTILESLEALERRWPIDLVLERYSLWSYAGLQFARRRGIPFFLEFNAPLAAQQAEYRSLFNAATATALGDVLLTSADRVIVPSRVLAEHVIGRGCRRGRVRIIPCGVARELFLPSAAPPRRRTRDQFVVGFLGSLKPWHGIDVLLEAFRLLREQSAAYRLLVVGDGPLRDMVEDRCRALPSGSVALTGAVPHTEVPGYLTRMDVGVAAYPELPLFYFSPHKIFEYAAGGVPIVASTSGQIADLLVHRESALLHPPGRVRKIVKHIALLREHPDLGIRLARRARRLVAQGYTWDRLAARLLSTASHVLSENRRSRPPHE